MIQAGRQQPVKAGAIIDGRYCVERELFQGAANVVFVARQLANDKAVAIKLLFEDTDVTTKRRFIRGGRAIQRIESEHLPRVYEVGKLDTGQPYMVMELLTGRDLATIIAPGDPLAVPDVIDYGLQTCIALSHVHRSGVIHRDVEPANLFLTERSDGSTLVKLLGFGIAKVNALTVNSAQPTLTQTGAILGSPRFMAPEQMHAAQGVDQRTDIWSLGGVLHELLSGRPAFSGDNLAELCVNILQNPPAPLLVLRPELPPELAAVIGKCLHKEPEGRYDNIGQLARALAPFGGSRAHEQLSRITGSLAENDEPSGPESIELSTLPLSPTSETLEDQPAATVTQERSESEIYCATDHTANEARDADLSLIPGEIFAGKYRIEQLIGRGGMATVTLALHLGLRRQVAIKVLKAPIAKPVMKRFEREARILAGLDNEHLVKVFDVDWLPTGRPYVVMEFLKGTDLSQLLRERSPLPIAEAVAYVLQACVGLAEAHAADIVHRDLKPANLFLADQPDQQPQVKVLDFGISKLRTSFGQATTEGTLTPTDAMMGTPAYMSPELWTNAKMVDPRSDIWALGVILYESITGQKPFDGKNLIELGPAVLLHGPLTMQSLRADTPPELAAVVSKCLATIPEERHADLADLARALEPFTAEPARGYANRIAEIIGADAPVAELTEVAPVPPTAAEPAPTPAPASSSRKRLPLWLSLVAVAGGLIALLAWFVFRTGSDNPCKQTDGCATYGFCTPAGNICVVGSKEDCLGSLMCKRDGLCSPKGGNCVAGNEQDCLSSERCTHHGYCNFIDGVCTKKSRCAETMQCRKQGMCTDKNGMCIWGNPEDCQRYPGCKSHGACTPKNGKCVPGSDHDCRQSEICRATGKCTLKHGKCVPGSEHDCLQSRECRLHGACLVVNDQSVQSAKKRTPINCRDSQLCKVNGRCTKEDAACRATRENDCRQSLWCRRFGLCGLDPKRGRCIAVSAADCRQAEMCKSFGYCGLSEHACVALNDADCRSSRNCREYGECSNKDGRCIATNVADCLKSTIACKNLGKCGVIRNECAAVEDKDCGSSSSCILYGTCSVDKSNNRCQVADHIDCEKSLMCVKYQQCFHKAGKCVAGVTVNRRPGRDSEPTATAP